MWQAIASIVAALLTFVLRMMGKKKTASEILPDPSKTEQEQEEAKKRAEQKFGPRKKQ
jgi:hypothetical protein